MTNHDATLAELEEQLKDYIELANASIAAVSAQSEHLGNIAGKWQEMMARLDSLEARVSLLERSVVYRDRPGEER